MEREIPSTYPDRPAARRARGGVPSEDKREGILKVAEQLFAAQGYANTTIEQIADQLSVTKPYIYYYFSGKQEIFETLSWRPTVACFSVMDFPLEDRRPAHVKVVEGLEKLVRTTLHHYPSAFFAYLEPQVYTPEYTAAQKRIANRFYDRLCALMEQARDDGMLDFKDTKVTALAACSVVGFLFYWYRPNGRLSREQIIRELTESACRVIGLRRRKRRPSDPAPRDQAKRRKAGKT